MSEVRRVDVLGFHCPVPVHETRKALDQMERGQILEIISDDPESLHDIPALIDRMNIILESVTETAGEFTFKIINLEDE
jgi:tRNA 2-thiouridine synthesizing protein A